MTPDSEKPKPQDFDLTPEQYALYQGDQKKGVSLLSQLVGWAISISVFAWLEVGPGWLSAAVEPLFIVFMVGYLLILLGGLVWGAVSNSRMDSGTIVVAAGTLGILWPLVVPYGVGLLVQRSAVQFKRHRIYKNPVTARIKSYEKAVVSYQAAQEEAEGKRIQKEKLRQEAERQRRSEAERAMQASLRAKQAPQRKQEQYWKSLGGIEFEQELGNLYRAIGYHVQSTPVSGDQGVDLILRKDGKTTVVQCKAQKRPASPAVIRDLYGSMHHFKGDNAILACTGGFSDNVIKFARDKPITLISARDIARMAEGSGDGIQDVSESLPICPNLGCGRTMVLRQGSRGRFWGCPRYPTCRGTRDY